jgi:nicotinate dehydrogenase subunit B
VNGVPREVSLEKERSLLQVLREEIGLPGAKYACGEGACGACTVLLGAEPIRACVTSVREVADRDVTTIEGLAEEGRLHPVQTAFLDVGAMQCGYCTPGMILSAAALLERTPSPSDEQIREAMQGNVCRCCAYPRILRAVNAAARRPESREIEADRADAEPLPRPPLPWDLAPPARRTFFDALGPGVVLVVPPDAAPQVWSAQGGVWLHMTADRRMTAFTGKVDVGQDNRTALSAIVAEAAGVPLSSVRLVMGDTDMCPFDVGTFGSRSTADAGTLLGIAGAAAKRVLADGIEPDECRLETVTHEETAPVRPSTSPARIGASMIVTGARRFATDVDLPGLLHGAVLRPARIGASLRSLDVSAAEAMSGVTVVREDGFVGVVAPDPATAQHAVSSIDARWDVTGQPSNRTLEPYLRDHPAEIEGWGGSSLDERGDVDAALGSAPVRLDATYTTAYIAHTPLETRVAAARWDGDRVTVWTGTQVPFGVRADVAEALGVEETAVRVIVPPTGAAFGGKHGVEAATESARLARATGRPVKVRWSRAEEFAHGYLRPAAVIDVRSGAERDGKLLAWDFTNINAGAAAIAPPYAIADQRVGFQPAEAPLAQGSYRALAATANTFARESHVDEVAAACGVDPLELRLRNLTDARLADVLVAAAEEIGRHATVHGAGDGAAIGIACGVEKDARVATCVRISSVEPTIDHIVTAFDCGAVVDEDNLRNQIEGATVMALGGALFEAIRFEDGCILNGSMTDYRVPRFRDVPPIDVILVDRSDLRPAGAGETPMIAVAPAIANALAALTGERRRSLPLFGGDPSS